VLCGGLVIVLVFFATIGVIDFSDAPVLGIIALAMTIFWLVTMFTAARMTREDGRRVRDRERRGF
jgi:4-amino-4-deoxy-L-arabinose transferase-like glycosyltransferase